MIYVDDPCTVTLVVLRQHLISTVGNVELDSNAHSRYIRTVAPSCVFLFHLLDVFVIYVYIARKTIGKL